MLTLLAFVIALAFALQGEMFTAAVIFIGVLAARSLVRGIVR